MKVLAILAALCGLFALAYSTKVTKEEAVTGLLDTWESCLTCVAATCVGSCGLTCATGIAACVSCVASNCVNCWFECDELLNKYVEAKEL